MLGRTKKPDAVLEALKDSRMFPLILQLHDDIRQSRRTAIIIFATVAVIAAIAAIALPWLTQGAAQAIIDNDDNFMLAVFEITRSAAYAGLVASIVYGVLGLARAALDQATRYQKRKLATLFIHYVLVKYEKQIGRSSFDLAQVMDAMDAWNRNVESAYTKVKFGGGGDDWSVDASGEHVRLRHGARAVRLGLREERKAKD